MMATIWAARISPMPGQVCNRATIGCLRPSAIRVRSASARDFESASWAWNKIRAPSWNLAGKTPSQSSLLSSEKNPPRVAIVIPRERYIAFSRFFWRTTSCTTLLCTRTSSRRRPNAPDPLKTLCWILPVEVLPLSHTHSAHRFCLAGAARRAGSPPRQPSHPLREVTRFRRAIRSGYPPRNRDSGLQGLAREIEPAPRRLSPPRPFEVGDRSVQARRTCCSRYEHPARCIFPSAVPSSWRKSPMT